MDNRIIYISFNFGTMAMEGKGHKFFALQTSKQESFEAIFSSINMSPMEQYRKVGALDEAFITSKI